MKVMRAKHFTDQKITYPCIAQIKIDGVRAYVRDGVVYSRTHKPIPNKHVQKLFGHLHSYDGELLLSDDPLARVFLETQSAVMTIEGEPEVFFHVYDKWDSDKTYIEREHEIWLKFNSWDAQPYQNVLTIGYVNVNHINQLNSLYAMMVNKGGEGIMIRNPNAFYKQGDASKKNWELLKWKPKDDAEFEVVGYEERMINTNGEVGNRTSHKAGMVPAGDLGALILAYNGKTFKVGTGFDAEQRKTFWQQKESLIGKMAKVEYEGIAKNLPRFPSFKGFRDKRDIL